MRIWLDFGFACFDWNRITRFIQRSQNFCCRVRCWYWDGDSFLPRAVYWYRCWKSSFVWLARCRPHTSFTVFWLLPASSLTASESQTTFDCWTGLFVVFWDWISFGWWDIPCWRFTWEHHSEREGGSSICQRRGWETGIIWLIWACGGLGCRGGVRFWCSWMFVIGLFVLTRLIITISFDRIDKKRLRYLMICRQVWNKIAKGWLSDKYRSVKNNIKSKEKTDQLGSYD